MLRAPQYISCWLCSVRYPNTSHCASTPYIVLVKTMLLSRSYRTYIGYYDGIHVKHIHIIVVAKFFSGAVSNRSKHGTTEVLLLSTSTKNTRYWYSYTSCNLPEAEFRSHFGVCRWQLPKKKGDHSTRSERHSSIRVECESFGPPRETTKAENAGSRRARSSKKVTCSLTV